MNYLPWIQFLQSASLTIIDSGGLQEDFWPLSPGAVPIVAEKSDGAVSNVRKPAYIIRHLVDPPDIYGIY